MAVITSPSSASVSATLTTTSWWLEAISTAAAAGNVSAVPINVLSIKTIQAAPATAHYTLGAALPSVVTDVTFGAEGSMSVRTFTAAAYTTLKQLVAASSTLWLSSPYGDGLYVHIGPPGASAGATSGGGMPAQVRSGDLQPGSTAAQPVHTVTLSYLQVARP